MANEDIDLELGEEKKGGNKMLIIIIAVLLLLVVAGAALFFLKIGPFAVPKAATAEGETTEEVVEEAPKEQLPAIYHSMDEAMIVNLVSPKHPRYLQLKIQFLVRGEDAVNALDLHMPVIRNNVNLLIGVKSYAHLQEPGAKETLRKDILTEVKSVLKDRTGIEYVDDLFFDVFVVQ